MWNAFVHTYGHNDSWRVLPTWKQATVSTPEGWEDALLVLEEAGG